MGRHSQHRTRSTEGRTLNESFRRGINWPWRCLVLLLIGPTAALAFVGLLKLADVPLHVGSAAMPAASCWRTELANAIADIDPRRNMPLVVDDIDDAWGRTNLDTGLVRIDPDVPCRQVRGVVVHEWGHWMQHRIYGSGKAARAALPSVEINADCVAEVLAPNDRRAYLGDRDCTPAEVHLAKLTMQGVAA